LIVELRKSGELLKANLEHVKRGIQEIEVDLVDTIEEKRIFMDFSLYFIQEQLGNTFAK